MNKNANKVFTLLGDGELSEGSVWEAFHSANKYKLDNLVVIIDRNKLQITGKTEDVNPIEPLNDKFKAFGLEIREVVGNDLKQLNDLLAKSFDKNENTLVFTIYGNQNQRRYIGIKLK